jgi:hypothetical protein
MKSEILYVQSVGIFFNWICPRKCISMCNHCGHVVNMVRNKRFLRIVVNPEREDVE